MKKPFIVDVELLPIVERAENGDMVALTEVADAFSTGSKAIQDYERAILCTLKIASYYPNKIPYYNDVNSLVSYPSVFRVLGELYLNLEDYSRSLKWYKKSILCARKEYPPQRVQEFIEKDDLINQIKKIKAYRKHIRTQRMKHFFEDIYIKLFWKRHTAKISKPLSKD